ncbi:hypothetical protein A2303_07170 [Candidatus Falkowbacteria bacterium RIFOXYB2_FULL_47_14]|uniref:Uncharacterized protein n=1 Tax=Candidatus Falkowbacteria bacterium RIFOXYA2_FULL_47_19 TaxID=1797994 RepID=A0A1F5SG98_9BACT|nr:MAG: hypothetical protein A2227_00915 [Candidatus Falkowbacteria bacterium RIFOXYA2_FULL_47_19]OGF34930.1 MAG: hypothetical protein A2468_06875 [Candidatus Falkowbacteria bacterium RIFOXYC2_FULL_46_15]OGF43645.1 MAG: hypothetical protein A2303_07170 [Candidatus Falkowbacteria bacterium RIFOXYB2_FULL_47_14]
MTALKLDQHDKGLTECIQGQIKEAIVSAHNPVAVAKRIGVIATKHRNKGRISAKKRYPFKGICENSGLPIDKSIASLDEVEPEKGYSGILRWVCQKANNSGLGTCGKC